jgi:putative transposase
MARFARVVAVDTPHHVTQRGNARRFILDSDTDRLLYLELLRECARVHQLSILGYCVMTNHVHLIVVPRAPDSLPLALKHAHGRYATFFNARQGSNGHVWQGRYYSCPLDEGHLWAALRYTEMNPVRAGMVPAPHLYAWSSAAAHLGMDRGPGLDLGVWSHTWTPEAWRDYLAEYRDGVETEAIRKSTHTGRPLGSTDFIQRLERSLKRRLTPNKGGRPKRARDLSQATLAFGK